ncbi:MAG: hypothetical protein AAHH96_05000 [Candidatus Symbiodolus clandestinus]
MAVLGERLLIDTRAKVSQGYHGLTTVGLTDYYKAALRIVKVMPALLALETP